MPGTMSIASLYSPRFVTGAARNNSPLIENDVFASCVSIIGDSALTVTVSVRVATFISMSTLNVLPARIRIPSRTYAAKPVNSALKVRLPGGRLSRR